MGPENETIIDKALLDLASTAALLSQLDTDKRTSSESSR